MIGEAAPRISANTAKLIKRDNIDCRNPKPAPKRSPRVPFKAALQASVKKIRIGNFTPT